MKWKAFRAAWLWTALTLFVLLLFGGWYGARRAGQPFPEYGLDIVSLALAAVVLGLVGGVVGLVVQSRR